MAHTKKVRPRTASLVRPFDGPAIGLLLDLENLLHDTRRVSGAAIRLGFEQIMAQLGRLGSRRYAVGACDYWLAKALCPTAGDLGVRVYPGPAGRDRADRELLLRGTSELPESVDLLVIGSGDGAFTSLARQHRDAGRRVVIAGRPGHISRALAEVADELLLIDLAPSTALAA